MASFLDNLKRGIKGILDRTTIDDQLFGAANQVKQNVQRSVAPVQQKVQQVARVADYATRPVRQQVQQTVQPAYSATRKLIDTARQAKQDFSADIRPGGFVGFKGPTAQRAAPVVDIARRVGENSLNKFVKQATPIAQNYVKTYQKVAPFVPFMPQYTAPAPGQKAPVADWVRDTFIQDPKTKQLFPQGLIGKSQDLGRAQKAYERGEISKEQLDDAMFSVAAIAQTDPLKGTGRSATKVIEPVLKNATKLPAALMERMRGIVDDPVVAKAQADIAEARALREAAPDQVDFFSPDKDKAWYDKYISDVEDFIKNRKPTVREMRNEPPQPAKPGDVESLFSKSTNDTAMRNATPLNAILRGEAIRPEVEKLISSAQKYDAQFKAGVEDIAKAIGTRFEHGPVKDAARAVEKVVTDYAGDISQLRDANRSTLLVDGADAVGRVVEAVKRKFGNIERIKDRFSASGYKSAIINVRTPNGTIAEIQLTTPEMLKAKTTLGGHKLYKMVRAKVGDVAKYAEEMNRLYSEADAATAARLNSSSVTSIPSDNALPIAKGSPADVVPTTSSPASSSLTNTPSTSKNFGNSIDGQVTGNTPIIAGKPQQSNIDDLDAIFNPSRNWQDVPDGVAVPPGGTYRVNMETGKSQARWDNVPAPAGADSLFPQRPQPRPPQTLNVERLNVDNNAKDFIASLEDDAARTTMKNQQVVDTASTVKPRGRAPTQDQTAKRSAEDLALRQKIVTETNQFFERRAAGATPEELEDIMRQVAKDSKVSRQSGTDIGRQLQARKIIADELDTPMQRVFKLLDNAGVDEDAYIKRATSVDWNNADDVVNFYRDFVPPKWSDWLDTLRYNSMLSSPNTHINNAFSNVLGSSIVAPVEKMIAGGIDAVRSAVTRTPRTRFAREGGAYIRGYMGGVREGVTKFADVMRGKSGIENLDMNNIPIGNKGIRGKIAQNLKIPMKLLEASDQFFTSLVKGGEREALKYRQGRGVKVNNIEQIVEDKAAYRLYRDELYKEGQGPVLDAFDRFTGLVMQARNSKNPIVSQVSKFTLPFVKTPMNILKQAVEYGPTGLATLPGSNDKTGQLAKAILGSSMMMGAATLLGSGSLTWAVPTNKKEKNAFYAAGMQPYSIKIGDNWVNYAKLPPAVAFPMALVASIDDAMNQQKITQSTADAVLAGVAKYGNFFADQSYLKSIGDLVATLKGDTEGASKMISNYPQQVIPWRAMGGWLARLTDPLQRQTDYDAPYIEQQVQELFKNIPGLSQTVPARIDELSGMAVENQNRVLNAFSPLRVTTERPLEKSFFDTLQAENKAKRDMDAMETASEGEIERLFGQGAQAGATDGTGLGSDITDPKMKALVNYYKFNEVDELPANSEFQKAKKDKALYDKVDEVFKSKTMTEDQQNEFVAQVTGKPVTEVQYYRVAKTTEDERYGFAVDALASLGANDDPFTVLSEMRRSVNDKMILTSGVIDELVDEGFIDSTTGKALKKVEFGQNGALRSGAGGSGGGGGKAAAKKEQAELDKIFAADLKPTNYSFSKVIAGMSKSGSGGSTSPRGGSALEKILAQRRRSTISDKPPA